MGHFLNVVPGPFSSVSYSVTDETKVNSIVEGISFSDVLNSYGDFRAGDASKTAVSNYEKKHNLKDGKSIENPNPNPNPNLKLEDKTDDMAAIIANAVSAAVKPLSDKLAQFETEKLQATRQEQIMAKAKEYGIPENYAKRCAIKDDEDLDAYFKDLKQEFANDGFKGPYGNSDKLINLSSDMDFISILNLQN